MGAACWRRSRAPCRRPEPPRDGNKERVRAARAEKRLGFFGIGPQAPRGGCAWGGVTGDEERSTESRGPRSTITTWRALGVLGVAVGLVPPAWSADPPPP